jgi:hypothetical protein
LNITDPLPRQLSEVSRVILALYVRAGLVLCCDYC